MNENATSNMTGTTGGAGTTGVAGVAKRFTEYAPALESRSIVTIRSEYGLWIAGEERDAEAGAAFDSVDPATGQHLTRIAEASQADVDAAVAAARSAYENVWRDMAPANRASYLFRIARLIQERAREFAVLESIDGGKPIRESRDVDVPLAAAHFFYYAGWADKLPWAFTGGVIPRPLGVAAQIIPWNFPLMMAAWKLAPALACGNTVVLKPAETTSLTALLLTEVLTEAELPPGVVNIVTGGASTGAALAGHRGIDKVAFTGSTEVGRSIRRATATTGARLTLELGGKSAQIVFEDAPMDQAIEGVVRGIWFNQGHVCCAGSRLLLQESIAEEFSERLQRRVEGLKVGDPLDKNTDIGAINSAEQLEKIEELCEVALSEGARMYRSSATLPAQGWYCAPTIFSGVDTSHRITNEEVFGPVLAQMTFRTPAEAVAKANATPYGLAAGVWTDNGAKILWMSQQLRAGVVWANSYNQFDPASPFGGMRESGFGREGGRSGLDSYVTLEDAS
jgi:acyl-CoA reductase-like NAD-dependent aldehyde dehydrogenase